MHIATNGQFSLSGKRNDMKSVEAIKFLPRINGQSLRVTSIRLRAIEIDYSSWNFVDIIGSIKKKKIAGSEWTAREKSRMTKRAILSNRRGIKTSNSVYLSFSFQDWGRWPRRVYRFGTFAPEMSWSLSSSNSVDKWRTECATASRQLNRVFPYSCCLWKSYEFRRFKQIVLCHSWRRWTKRIEKKNLHTSKKGQKFFLIT